MLKRGCLPRGHTAELGKPVCFLGNQSQSSGPQNSRDTEPTEGFCGWQDFSSSSAGKLTATKKENDTRTVSQQILMCWFTMCSCSVDLTHASTDLISVDAVHFLLHGTVGLQHRSKNFNSCIQRAVIWSHCNQTENNRGPTNTEETIGCTAGTEHTHTWKEEARSLANVRCKIWPKQKKNVLK